MLDFHMRDFQDLVVRAVQQGIINHPIFKKNYLTILVSLDLDSLTADDGHGVKFLVLMGFQQLFS